MQNKGKGRFLAAVLAAGTLWGFMGLFQRVCKYAGIDSAGVILLRCGVAAILFFVTILLRDPRELRIKLRDSWCFLGTGLCSMLFFTYCYFQAMNYVSLSVAAILLYTAPVFVSVLSAVLFREAFGKGKLAALGIAFAGCCLVSGLGREAALSWEGLLFGLGAGIGYGLYSIFAKLALERGYSTMTINLYTHSLAALGAGMLWGFGQPLEAAVSSLPMAGWILAMGLLTCYLPYLLYTYSLTGLEAGRASIAANVEPVVATLVGVCLFRETMTAQHIVGVALVLCAVVLLSVKEAESK